MLPALGPLVAFLLSGAAGLIFQMTWFYRCALVMGSSVASATVVLSGFMGGLAAGNLLASRYGERRADLMRTYAVLEGIVAVAGIAVTYLLPHVSAVLVPMARQFGEVGAGIHAIRFLTAFVLLAVPATAMGATLPLLVAALCRRGDGFGRALGRLYGINTIGAVAGVLLTETLLVSYVGVAGSAWVAGALNLAAGAIALAVARAGEPVGHAGPVDQRVGAPPAARRGRPGVETRPAGIWRLHLAAALAGATLLALEVIWFRFLSMYVLVTTAAMSLMLAVVLSGIGLGGMVASACLLRRPAAPLLPWLACSCGALVVASYAVFQWGTAGTQVGDWWRVLWFACVLTLPVSLGSGVLFTFIGDALHRRGLAPVASAGGLATANTLGAIAGPALAAYLMLPRLGMEGSLFVCALAYAGVAWSTLDDGTSPVRAVFAGGRSWQVARVASAALLLAALVLFPFGSMNRRYFPRAAAAYDADGSTIVATREGPAETLFVMQQRWMGEPVYSRLVTNGFSMSGTALLGQRYMRAFAYYPMLLHDGPLRRALVVCYGVGVTVGAVTHIPSVQSIDVAEISPDVVAMSDAVYAPGSRPLGDARVHLHIDDGRFFLQTTTERYDLITGEPPPPRTPGTVNIYTREYLELVRDRLAEGGLATYWVPVGRPSPGTDVNTVIRAFCDVFRDCSLWNATPFDLMLVGTRGLRGPRTLEQFAQPWQTPGLEARLREVGFERAEQIGATFVGDAPFLDALTRETPPLTDDFPQRLRPAPGRPSLSDPLYGVDRAVTQMFQATLDPERARQAFAASAFIRGLWPASLIERTLPYFEQQAVINRVYWDGGRPLRHIEDLDALLSNTTLRTLPLWVLGSDEVRQRIGEASRDGSGALEYTRGLRALSGRDFTGAARAFAAAAHRGLQLPTLGPLEAYALFKSGQLDAARTLASQAQPHNDDERHFWAWLEAAAAVTS